MSVSEKKENAKKAGACPKVFLFSVKATKALTFDLLTACCLLVLPASALKTSCTFCTSQLFRCGSVSLKGFFTSTSTRRQPPAHISVLALVCEKRRVTLNILAGAPTFINLSCQMPSVHPPLTPAFPATMAAIKSSALWLFDGESWPDTLCSCEREACA